ncbi:hypothetical protein RB195_010095 [Necator americanus]|uniref:GDP-fucose protein O-fucosyltransferase 2 n=1 Tax=Necator americanus TaxID=51031 RepID=A0ABR1CX36_NECAM
MWDTLILLITCMNLFLCNRDTVSIVDDTKYSVARDTRFLIYDVNHGEGFNLRRDVYMRIANTVRLLREAGEPFVLVLPPWGALYHWQRQEVKLKWSVFFDVENLNEFVPVMEFETFVQEQGNIVEQVVYLQPYKEGWSGEYVLKYDHRDCIDGSRFYKFENNAWRGWFFSYENIRAKKFECLSLQGDSDTLKKVILEEYPGRASIFIDRAETILHQHYGDVHYWEARRSMRYARYLIEAGNLFRMTELSSSDEKDRTELPSSFRDERPRRDALGGDYVCAHWRRKDFLRAHGKELPSIKETARKVPVEITGGEHRDVMNPQKPHQRREVRHLIPFAYKSRHKVVLGPRLALIVTSDAVIRGFLGTRSDDASQEDQVRRHQSDRDEKMPPIERRI